MKTLVSVNQSFKMNIDENNVREYIAIRVNSLLFK